MNWNNLRNNKCPQCNKDFVQEMAVYNNPRTMEKILLHERCGFKISEKKYIEFVYVPITSKQNLQRLESTQNDGEEV